MGPSPAGMGGSVAGYFALLQGGTIIYDDPF